MDQLDIGNGNSDIYQLLNLMKEIPGSSICYQNPEGIILWHNNYSVHDLKLTQNNIIGKTVFEIFSAETAKFCLEYNLDVINSGNVICEQHQLQLITGEIQKHFVTVTPWMIMPEQAGGVIVNSINMETICKQFKICYANNQQSEELASQLQNLYFNFKPMLKEILLLANLIMSWEIDSSIKDLCLQLRNFAKILLSDCDHILESKGIINAKHIPLIFQKIDLRKLVQEIFNKQIKIIKGKNARLFLTVSSQVPEIVISDVLYIKTVLQLIIENLLKSALGFNDVDTKIYCKIELIRKINNKKIIVSLVFEGGSHLFKNFFTQDQYVQRHPSLLIHEFSNNNDDNIGLSLVHDLVKELEGNVELIDNKTTSKIIINLPLEVGLSCITERRSS